MSWLIYKRGKIEPFRAAIPLRAVFKFQKHASGAVQPRTFYVNTGEKLYWNWEKETFDRYWRKLVDFWRSPAKTKKHFETMAAQTARAIKAADRTIAWRLDKFSDDDLVKIHSRLLEAILPAHFILNTEVDAIDIFFTDFFKKIVAGELPAGTPPEIIDDVFKALILPVSRSYINKQERFILSLAVKRDFSLAAARRAYRRFFWTNLGWENMRPHSLEYFQKLIRRKGGAKDLRDQTRHLDDFLKNNRRLRNECLKKYRLSAALKRWLAISDWYIDYHDKRKEVQVKTTYAAYLILREVARRRHLNPDDLEWLWHDELIAVLRGRRLDQQEIKRRRQAIAALVGYHKFQFWSGTKASETKKKYVKIDRPSVRELRGMGVMGGLIRGRVKVCAGAAEALAKIKSGDILVCPMTLPDYLPAMRKAKAIITEEGGITCHAAIIARELKIPCVVGTKIATEVLRDGDKVAIDARRGIIKILN